MDFTDVAVLLEMNLGVEISATADIWDWYPPDSPRPDDAPQWSAKVTGSMPLSGLMSVGARGYLHIDGTGTRVPYGVVAVYDHMAELRGRTTITTITP
jgi:hypothetical protein